MRELSRYLFLAGALTFIALGALHVIKTPQGTGEVNGLSPLNAEIRKAMAQEALVLTGRTNLWRDATVERIEQISSAIWRSWRQRRPSSSLAHRPIRRTPASPQKGRAGGSSQPVAAGGARGSAFQEATIAAALHVSGAVSLVVALGSMLWSLHRRRPLGEPPASGMVESAQRGARE